MEQQKFIAISKMQMKKKSTENSYFGNANTSSHNFEDAQNSFIISNQHYVY
jgi:hypothetical protein